MTLDDLLDYLRRDVLHDRSDRVAGDSDQLWSDTTLIRYLDMAQRRFARRSLCIRDGTSAVTRFTTVAWTQSYTLDPSIISVYSMRSQGNGLWINGVYTPGAYDTSDPPIFVPSGAPTIWPDEADLGRASHAARSRQDIPDGYWWDVNNLATLNPGKPLVFDTDDLNVDTNGVAGTVSVRLFPNVRPDCAGAVMQMRVARLPAARLTPNDMQASPEIPEDYHLDFVDYAAYLALRIVDHELGDPDRAQEFKAQFDQNVELARTEMQRKTFAPQTWGFGRNGFSFVGN